MILPPLYLEHRRIPCVVAAPIRETGAVPRLIWDEFDFLNYVFVIAGENRNFIDNSAKLKPWASIFVFELNLFAKACVGRKLLPLSTSNLPDVSHVQTRSYFTMLVLSSTVT